MNNPTILCKHNDLSLREHRLLCIVLLVDEYNEIKSFLKLYI